ncbi:hypothetical protein IGI42_004052 [Enterococcus sp. AZ109]
MKVKQKSPNPRKDQFFLKDHQLLERIYQVADL